VIFGKSTWGQSSADTVPTRPRSIFVNVTDHVLMERQNPRPGAQNVYLLNEILSEKNFGDIIGTSCGLRKVMKEIELVAPTDATVLITGESGTGKELIARAVHEQSTRNSRALIKLNCCAVPRRSFRERILWAR
jgi:transcriptional regulator with GAF, ATPase, and Fis domain